MSASRSTYRLLCTPSAVTRLHINLSWKNKLKITSWPTEWFAKFPGLVSIGLFLNPGSQVKLSAETVSSLPRNLRHLHLGFVDSISDDMLSYLPPFLLTLNLEKNYRITDRGFKNMPESLEALHLPENTITSSHCIPFLPTTLKSLSIRTTDEISEALVRQLPALTTLRLCGSVSLPGPSISSLPTSLKLFNWSLKQGLDTFEMTLLPTGLVDLTCHILQDPDNTLASLPPGLLRLTITHNTPISEKGIELIPRGLTSLELTSDSSLPSAAIRRLPPNLQYLCLLKNDLWTSTDIMDLPSSIHTLKLGQNANFSNACFAILPPSIYFFSCKWNENITSNCIKYAPPSLKRLELKVLHVDSDEQPIDFSFPNVITMPRYSRERTKAGSLIYLRCFDVYLFELDSLTGRIRQLDIAPKNVPPFYPGPRVN